MEISAAKTVRYFQPLQHHMKECPPKKMTHKTEGVKVS
jgi:hypothetical protein